MKQQLQHFTKSAALPFFLSRLAVIAIIVLTHAASLESVPAREGTNFHSTVTFSFAAAVEALRCTWSSADAAWYFGIADNGYAPGPFTASEPKNWVFFPLWPLLIRALNILTGSSPLSAALLSAVLFFAGLILLQFLAARRGLPDVVRERMLWLVCFFPVSYFFSSGHSEALFFFLLVAAWLAAESGRAVTAGLCFALLTAARPTGLLLLPAFAVLLAERRVLRSARGVIGLLLAPLGAILFALYLRRLTGNPLAFELNQPAWGRSASLDPKALVAALSDSARAMGPWVFYWLDYAALAASAWAAAALAYRRRFADAWLVAVPPWVGALTGMLFSIPRFLMPLFPLYFLLAVRGERPQRERILLVLFAAGLAIMTLLYARHVTAAMT